MKGQAIGACVVVKNPNDKRQVLIGKRSGLAYLSGYYGIPGGRVEPGEKLELTAKRELEEETGLRAIEMDYVGVIKEWQQKWFFIHFVFVCTNYSRQIENREAACEGWEWEFIDNLPNRFVPGHRKAIEMVENPKSLVEME